LRYTRCLCFKYLCGWGGGCCSYIQQNAKKRKPFLHFLSKCSLCSSSPLSSLFFFKFSIYPSYLQQTVVWFDVGQTLSGCCCRVLCCGLPAALAAIVEKGGVSGILGRGCNGAHAFSFYIFQEKISIAGKKQRTKEGGRGLCPRPHLQFLH